MCCVSPSPSASATSSRRGQIVAAPGSPRYSGGPPPSPPPIPRAAADTDDEEFGGRPAKRARPESGGGDGGGAADQPSEDGRDRISELPDAVLLSVLSNLPLRDAGRTAALSSRWRSLFDQSVLDFNACQPFPPEEGRGCEWFISAITDILAARPQVRIRSFRVVMYGQGFAGHQGAVDGWFRALARHGVRELGVDMFYTAPTQILPRSLLDLASLETLKVYRCSFPDAELGPAPRLRALRTLELSSVNVSQHSLQSMLSHCASLECVKLKNIIGVYKICLRSKSLARLYGDFGNLTELVVEDAPNLEELVGIGLTSGTAKVKIISAPKLQVLGYLGISVRPLVLHDTVFDGGIVQLRTLMHNVKTLAIQVPFSEKGYTVFVSQLLKCFPCLEVLQVEPDERSISRWVNVEEWDTAISIQCIEHSINRVVFENFGGEECQMGFLTFLLGMARALKVVEFYCWKSKDWTSDQIELMSPIKNRASPDADLLFFRNLEPVSNLYLCHCCPQRCVKGSRVDLV
ncbi:hypothetical protein ACP70R_036844 [Stipagrostis hirtigluma subsp. patula]